jgi:hypothetical protein
MNGMGGVDQGYNASDKRMSRNRGRGKPVWMECGGKGSEGRKGRRREERREK